MSTFADELRALSETAKASQEPTAKEIERFVNEIKLEAQTHAKKGTQRYAVGLIDQVRGNIRRGPNTAIEEALKAEGFQVVYSSDLSCGMCNLNDCSRGAHFGYKIFW